MLFHACTIDTLSFSLVRINTTTLWEFLRTKMKKIQHLDISNVGRFSHGRGGWEKEFSMQVNLNMTILLCVFFVRLTDKQACLWFYHQCAHREHWTLRETLQWNIAYGLFIHTVCSTPCGESLNRRLTVLRHNDGSLCLIGGETALRRFT